MKKIFYSLLFSILNEYRTRSERYSFTNNAVNTLLIFYIGQVYKV